MEAAEELSLGTREPTTHHHIIKGKRTKRQRPQSPVPFSITANSSSGDFCAAIDKDHCDNNTTSSAEYFPDSATEEEEDMANCLILLARGQSRESSKHAEEDSALNYAKYSSRKFLEAASAGVGKAGIYVYECKTCNRTFPSFQALGGHRASHKKPKNVALAIENEKKQLLQQQHQQQFLLSSDEEESQFKKNNNVYSQLSLQLNSRGNLHINNNNNKSKVHECSICGAEFTSGQALGGHMRRHRAPVNGTSTALSLTPLAIEVDEEQPKKQKAMLSLELDLNLPAPEDDHKESKFGLTSKHQHQQQQQQQKQPQQQQSNLVFSAPALVDCHY